MASEVDMAALRRLARSLVYDSNSAGDLVQEAWLAALRSGPGPEVSTGWLFNAVRRIARGQRRDEQRRRAREQRAAQSASHPASNEATDEASARIEVLRRLVEAVDRLEAPYRSAIVQRFFDALPPREIARRSGLPVNTVRTHVRRGLAQLRQDLDGPDARGRESFLAALIPLAGPMPWSVALGLPPAASALSTSLGVALVNKTLLATTAAVLILTVGWLGLRSFAVHSPDSSGGLDPVPETNGASRKPTSDRLAVDGDPSESRVARDLDLTPSPHADPAPANVGGTVSLPMDSTSSLDSIARTFLSDQPDVDGLDRLLTRMAYEAMVETDSISTNPVSGEITGRIRLGESMPDATFWISGHQFMIETSSSNPAAARDGLLWFTLSLGFTADSAGVERSHASVQFYPDTRVPSSTIIAQGQEQYLGWTMNSSGTKASIKPIAMRASEDGVAWEIGAPQQLQGLPNPWRVGLPASQILYQKLSQVAD